MYSLRVVTCISMWMNLPDLIRDFVVLRKRGNLSPTTTNKASGGDEIPGELFQIIKDDAMKVLHSICQQIWKTQQWPQDWKRLVFIPIPKKGNAKECSNYHKIALISHATKETSTKQETSFKGETDHQPRLDAWDKCSGLVHWDDPEGWDGEGGGRGIGMGNTCKSMADSLHGKNHYNIVK